MNKIMIIVCVLVGLVVPPSSYAETLRFPKTEAEFVDALSPKPSAHGLTRGLKTRGLGGITAPTEPPKAGALINFDYDSDWIKTESYRLLDNLGNALNGGLSDAVILVVGHTDSRGSDEYNHDLSVRRARAVADYLIHQHNVADIRLVVQGYGESTPIADNGTSKGRSMNRRVEFIRQQ